MASPSPEDVQAIAVLPNISIGKDEPISIGNLSLVSSTDSAVSSLREELPALDEFLNRFYDSFGKQLTPCVVLHKHTKPKERVEREALAGFRDAISASVICKQRSKYLLDPTCTPIYSSSFFDIDPRYIGTDNQLIIDSGLVSGVGAISHFRGSNNPHVTTRFLQFADADAALLQQIESAWLRRFSEENPKKADIALFRSLNMARHATSASNGLERSFYDAGLQIAQWVSAFEILIHPSKNHANERLTSQVIGSYFETMRNELPATDLEHYLSCSLAILEHLYRIRNDFLHGNPVAAKGLRLGRQDTHVNYVAPAIYRLLIKATLHQEAPNYSQHEDDSTSIIRAITQSEEEDLYYQSIAFPFSE
ncbi:hypothetical protein [Thalassospira sp.]|uniref:hypothetical protein n=1 Tax=Thalassospira sp. TaxID=1912094 RepID=UPI001AFD08DD|nr:hypothetical protein [Thalassospira sp.]MBO6806237.1 hypothetical protein [Thalassospira sp.]MBO6839241.1 hypothetical protein [Thalassospira sp.]